MSDYKIWTCRTDDDGLETLVTAFRSQSEGKPVLTFVEGPAYSGFIETAVPVSQQTALTILWQLRTFTPTAELAARRFSFEDGGDWLVRWIGTAGPSGTIWSESEELGVPGKPKATALYGQYIRHDEHGSADLAFREQRYSNADLNYPVPDDGSWRDGNYAWLEFTEHLHATGSTVRWCSVKRNEAKTLRPQTNDNKDSCHD